MVARGAATCFLISFSLSAQTPPQAKKSPAIDFVKIAPGEFQMGCSAGDSHCTSDEPVAHPVLITVPFELGKYEVTQAQWQAVMGSNPSTIKSGDRPVETVSKNDVEDFLAKLNALNDGYKYRLPTEAEWEYAARAGQQGTPPLDEVAWYADNSGDETHPVGQKKPNAWGLYDMLGNVREWVSDDYARNPNNPVNSANGPGQQEGARGGRGRGGFGRGGRGRFGGPMRQLPIVRGGAWDNPADFVRLSARYHYYGPTLRVSDIGFRLAREPIVHNGANTPLHTNSQGIL